MKKNFNKTRLANTLSLLVLASPAFVTLDLTAAEPETETKKQKPGYYTGSFRILPELQLTGYYDDNVFATEQGTESDYVAVVTPSVKINSLWDKHSLKLGAGASLGYFSEYTSEDYKDYWLDMKGKYALGEKTSLSGGLGYSQKHEGRDSKESIQIQDELTTYQVASAQAGARHHYEDLTFRAGVTYQHLDYDDVEGLSNDDRDRTLTGLGLRISKDFDKQLQLFAQGLFNERDYDQGVDQFGNNKDSWGYSAAVGVLKRLPRKGKIEAYAGLLSQEYDDGAFDTVTEPDLAVNLRVYPSETIKVTGKLTRAIKETTIINSSGYLYSRLDLQLDAKIVGDIVGYLSYGYGLAEYQEINREDKENAFGLGANYYMSPTVSFGASLSHYTNDSNKSFFDYDKNLVLLTAKIKFVPPGQ